MKKLICAALTLAMLLALAAFGAPAAMADKTPKSAASSKAELKAEDMFGEKEKNRYVNRSLGIQAEFPRDWTILSDEEAASLMGIGLDVLDNEKLTDLLDQNAAVFDLYAMKTDNSGDNLNIQLQKLNTLQNTLLPEEQIAAASAKELEDMMKGTGMEITSIEQSTVVFAGEEHPCLSITMEIQGVAAYERLVLIKGGDYYACITAFSLDQARAEEMLDLFEAA
jgi:hypothetical protein